MIKVLEIKDGSGLIPIICFNLEVSNAFESDILSRAGFGLSPSTQAGFIFMCLPSFSYRCDHDPLVWKSMSKGKIFFAAHKYVLENWEHVQPGDVLDIRFLVERGYVDSNLRLLEV